METTSTSETQLPSSLPEPKVSRLRSLLRRKAKADAEAHATALDVLLKALDAFSLTAPRAVMHVISAVEDALEASVLSLDVDSCVRGVRTSFFQDLLREISQRGPGRELSRRQRAVWVRPLNAVREALQPLISVQLEPVANYARAPRAFAISARANAFLRPSDVQKIERTLLARDPEPGERFAHAALLLIFHAGLTFEGVLKGLCRLRVCDVRHDVVHVPRDAAHARWLRVWLDEPTRQALTPLTLSCPAPTGKRGRPRKPVPLAPLTHLVNGQTEVPDEKAIVEQRKAINAYLARVCAEANVPAHPVSAWLPVIRWVQVAGGRSKVEVCVLAGQLDIGYLPRAQCDADWLSEPELPAHDAPALALRPVGRHETRPQQTRSDGDVGVSMAKVRELRDLLRDKEDVPAVRASIAAEMATLVEEWRTGEDTPSRNLTSLARWLAQLLAGRKRLGTLRAYLSDGLWLVRFAGSGTVADLGDAEVEAICEPDGHRRLSAWLSWRAFMKANGEALAPLSRRSLRRRRATVEEALLPPQQVGRLLAALSGNARLAAVAAYFGMLRIDEALHLRLCDMALLGDAPYLEIRNAKGGKSRRVYLIHAPAEAVRWLRDAQMRLLGVNSGQPLAERMRQRLVDLDVSSLEREMRRALRLIGAAGCTFHDLRKSRATALVLRSVDVRLVSRWLGHTTTGVTWGSYLRSFPLSKAMTFPTSL